MYPGPRTRALALWGANPMPSRCCGALCTGTDPGRSGWRCSWEEKLLLRLLAALRLCGCSNDRVWLAPTDTGVLRSCSCCRESQGAAGAGFAVEKIQAMFTVLGAFGSVTTGHSSSSTRFSMVLSLDFSATGRITAAHLQVPGKTGGLWLNPGVSSPCATFLARLGTRGAMLCFWTKGAPNRS